MYPHTPADSRPHHPFALALVTAVLVGVIAAPQGAQSSEVMVGGQAMYPNKDIIDNAVNSADHKTLVAAVKAAGIVETLKGKGPFTVFAPTDAAFDKLPAGTVLSLLKPENKATLARILTYHVVAGNLTSDAMAKAINEGGGKAEFRTISGGTLVATFNGPKNIILTDENGNTADIVTYDVIQSNGVIHVVDSVVLPTGRTDLDPPEPPNPPVGAPGGTPGAVPDNDEVS